MVGSGDGGLWGQPCIFMPTPSTPPLIFFFLAHCPSQVVIRFTASPPVPQRVVPLLGGMVNQPIEFSRKASALCWFTASPPVPTRKKSSSSPNLAISCRKPSKRRPGLDLNQIPLCHHSSIHRRPVGFPLLLPTQIVACHHLHRWGRVDPHLTAWMSPLQRTVRPLWLRTGATVYAVQHKDLVGAKRGTVETSVFFQGQLNLGRLLLSSPSST